MNLTCGKIISKKKFIAEKEYNRLENVNNIKKDMCLDAITMAYCEVAPKDLAAQYAYDDNL